MQFCTTEWSREDITYPWSQTISHVVNLLRQFALVFVQPDHSWKLHGQREQQHISRMESKWSMWESSQEITLENGSRLLGENRLAKCQTQEQEGWKNGGNVLKGEIYCESGFQWGSWGWWVGLMNSMTHDLLNSLLGKSNSPFQFSIVHDNGE